jgi:hypothetical protein
MKTIIIYLSQNREHLMEGEYKEIHRDECRHCGRKFALVLLFISYALTYKFFFRQESNVMNPYVKK